MTVSVVDVMSDYCAQGASAAGIWRRLRQFVRSELLDGLVVLVWRCGSEQRPAMGRPLAVALKLVLSNNANLSHSLVEERVERYLQPSGRGFTKTWVERVIPYDE